jgi:1-deoxy-D-xylulose-5-phosphate reductoisomerase
MTMLVPAGRAPAPLRKPGPIRISVLGSTGSIGASALEVVRSHPGVFEVVALAAGANAEKLAEQAAEFRPRYAALADESAAAKAQRGGHPAFEGIELGCGEEAVARLAALDQVDVVLAAVVGFAGLRSVLEAVRAGKCVALANKESLVAGGALVAREALHSRATIIPVDSEHSALFQALQGHAVQQVSKLVLTASGGPFLRTSIEKLKDVNPAQALQHPNWKMGAKITVDSATMMNKALEVIEACWLFGVDADKIDVVVHPQSIVHSLVAFVDGTQIAQLSVPDMKGPIAYALTYPGGRLPQVMPPLDLGVVGALEFLPLDDARFPAIELARRCMRSGGLSSAVLNIANEVAVAAFLRGRMPFTGIVPFAEEALAAAGTDSAGSYEDLRDFVAALRSRLEERVAA